MLVSLVKILIGDVVGIMLGRPNSARRRRNYVEVSKLSLLAVLKLCLMALKKLLGGVQIMLGDGIKIMLGGVIGIILSGIIKSMLGDVEIMVVVNGKIMLWHQNYAWRRR